MYNLKLTKNVLEEDLPKIQKSGIDLQVLHRSFNKLQTNPYGSSRAKTGDLQGIRGMDWNKGYRILFTINEISQNVVILAIDSHDNAYRKAKRRK